MAELVASERLGLFGDGIRLKIKEIYMAVRNIVQLGDPVLVTPCKAVESFDEKLHTLLDDMRDTMFGADGVGLAASQVGILRQAFVVCIDGENIYEFVNPIIVSQHGRAVAEEGCLSIQGIKGNVERPKRVTIKAQDRYAKQFEMSAKGLLARAICHEYDHLQGRLFLERIIV